MAVAMIGPKFYGWDKNGKPLAFGKLYTYQARTNDPKDTYQSEDQIVPNTNPVILNGEGYANVYLTGSYKMVLKDKDENEVWSSDPVSSAEPSEWVLCLTATYLSSTSFKVNGNFVTQYEPGRRVRIDNNTANYSYSTIVSSTFAAGETTLVLLDPVITTGVVESCVSIIGVESIDFESSRINDLSIPHYFTTLSEFESSEIEFPDGKEIITKERVSGHGGGASYIKISGVGTANSYDVVASSVVDQSITLNNRGGVPTLRQFGLVGDGVVDDSDAFEAACTSERFRAFIVEQPEVNYVITKTINFIDGNRRFIGDTSIQLWTLPTATQQAHFLMAPGAVIQLTNTTLETPETTSNIVWENVSFRGTSSASRNPQCFLWDVGGSANFSRGFIFKNCSAKWFQEVFSFTQSAVTAGNTTQKQVGDIQIVESCSFNFNDKVINTGTLGDSVQINKFKMDANDISNNITIGTINFFTGTVIGNIMEGHVDTLTLLSCRNFNVSSNHFEANSGEFIIKVDGDSRDGNIGENYYGAITAERKVWLKSCYRVDSRDEYMPELMYESRTPNDLKYDQTASGRSFGVLTNIASPLVNAIDGTTQASRQLSNNLIRVGGPTSSMVNTKLGNERVVTIPYSTTGAGLYTYTKTITANIGEYIVISLMMTRDDVQALDPYVQFYINGSADTAKGSWESPLNNFNKNVLKNDPNEEILFTFFAKALESVTSVNLLIAPYGISPTAGLIAQFSSAEIRVVTNLKDIKHSLNLAVLNTGDAAPTSGNFLVGDTLVNRNPSAAGPDRWRCVASGNPGTWKALTLDA